MTACASTCQIHGTVATWGKKLACLQEVESLNPTVASLQALGEKLKTTVKAGYIFRFEGLLGSVVVGGDKRDSPALVRKELAKLTGDHYNVGVTEDDIHVALLAAAKSLLGKPVKK